MNFKHLKTKLWFNIFVRVLIIFAAFTLILTLSNLSLLTKYFIYKEKSILLEQISVVDECDINNSQEIVNILSEINEKHNFDIEIYNKNGVVIYTTHGGQMMDYFKLNDPRFKMSHQELVPSYKHNFNDGTVYYEAFRPSDKAEFLLCSKEIDDGIFAEVRIQKQLISRSANIANEFILWVSGACLLLSIFWIYIFAKKFSKPISVMNTITKDMANLNFNKKITNYSADEIGQLSQSINHLSERLSKTLEDLNAKNLKLKNDIELQKQLDEMRKVFIANVSHELKTPIAVINSYAEGLKLDINPEAREEYCQTIIDEGNRMNKLVLSILQLSKYESGQIKINPTKIDISKKISLLSKRIFKNSSVEIINDIPENAIAFADDIQIEQVIIALLENAKAYTPKTGKISISVIENANYRISIENTGSHINSDVMPHIWQSFYRGDTSHKRDNSHFGLGLSIVSAIMKLHNTSCGVYNTKDGVCFWFELNKYI